MPRKCVPKNKFSRLDPELEQRTPHNRRCRLRKTIAAYFLFARAARHNVREKLLRSDADILVSPEQDALRGHRDPGEMSTAITERFAYDCESRFPQSIAKISPQLFSPDAECILANVVFVISLPPRIEDGARRRVLQQRQKITNRVDRHFSSTNHQTPGKLDHQAPKRNARNLSIGAWNFSGAWGLGFGVYASSCVCFSAATS